MARIIYGVSGQGFGHAMRSKVVIDYLERQNHRVEVLTYGQAYPYLKQFFSVNHVAGLQLIYKNNKVDYLATILHDTKKFPEAVRSYRAMSRLVSEFEPDIVFSDYEPMSSLLAHLNRLPLVSVGNHHFITHTKISYPKKYMKDFMATKVVTDAMTPRADAYLVTTIAEEEVKQGKTFLFPPIVGDDVRALKPSDKGSVVVYLTSQYSDLPAMLQQVEAERFVVYGFDREGQDGNVEYRKFSREGFLKDLSQAKAVIATAGFTVISEALYLGKPYLAIPINRQFEQIINALYIDRLGYGTYSTDLQQSEVEGFLSRLDVYRAKLQGYEKQGNDKIFDKIDHLIKDLSS